MNINHSGQYTMRGYMGKDCLGYGVNVSGIMFLQHSPGNQHILSQLAFLKIMFLFPKPGYGLFPCSLEVDIHADVDMNARYFSPLETICHLASKVKQNK